MIKEELLQTVKPRGYLGYENASVYYDALMALPEKGRMLEIGTGHGHSAPFFARAKPDWVIYTIDGWKVASPDFPGGVGLVHLGKLIGQWRAAGIFNIVPIVGNSFDVPWEMEIDALYIDGDHRYDAVKSDFERFTPFLKEGGVVLMDDYGIARRDIQVREFVDKELAEDWRIEPVEGSRGVALWQKAR